MDGNQGRGRKGSRGWKRKGIVFYQAVVLAMFLFFCWLHTYDTYSLYRKALKFWILDSGNSKMEMYANHQSLACIKLPLPHTCA
jgi:hypothetical protein